MSKKKKKWKNMIEAFDCCYMTPCGWCSKWDKECNNKTSTQNKCNDISKKPKRPLPSGTVVGTRECLFNLGNTK